MEREAHYAAVGAFVLLVVLVAGLFVYWYSDTREYRDMQRYEIYFEGSIAGLERGAPVRYLGVAVGRVAETRIDPRNPGRVMVLADVDATTPVSGRTVAELSLQGVTGLLYIDLVENRGNRPLTADVPSLEYPVIRSTRSSFDVFLEGLPRAIDLVTGVAERASLVFSDENLAALSGALRNIDAGTERLPETMRQVEALVAELRGAAADVRAVAASARTVMEEGGPELTTTLERFRVASENLASATERLDRMVEENRGNLQSFAQHGLPEFERLLRDGREAAREIRDLSRSLRDDPSQLIYQPPQQGVEIPR